MANVNQNPNTMEIVLDEKSIFKTLGEMVIDRAWNAGYNGHTSTVQDINALIASTITDITNNYASDVMETFWKVNDTKYAAKIISDRSQILGFVNKTFFDTRSVTKFIIVPPKELTNAEKQVKGTVDVEVFTTSELLRNISRHDIVPKHILLSAERADAVLAAYNITRGKLKKIYMNDPMNRYVGGKLHDIIEIIRPSLNGGYATDYRVVVYSPGTKV